MPSCKSLSQQHQNTTRRAARGKRKAITLHEPVGGVPKYRLVAYREVWLAALQASTGNTTPDQCGVGLPLSEIEMVTMQLSTTSAKLGPAVSCMSVIERHPAGSARD